MRRKMAQIAAIPPSLIERDASTTTNVGRVEFAVSGSISEAEFVALVEAACDSADLAKCPVPPEWALDLKEMLTGIAGINLRSSKSSALYTFCEYGARYGDQQLETGAANTLLSGVARKARRHLKDQLRRRLMQISRPCIMLGFRAFRGSLEAIHRQQGVSDSDEIGRLFVGSDPRKRLLAIFTGFPVLPRLWVELIAQWRNHVTEVLLRLAADRRALSRAFFHGDNLGTISDMRVGLSDPHNGGRTVTLLQFGERSVVYKPRAGIGELEWARLISWVNRQGFQPPLRAVRVLSLKCYCWMEHVQYKPCKNKQAVGRFYQRLGALMTTAHLIRAVDCHRDNVIASGEHPVLIDAEALWHPFGPDSETLLSELARTGFVSASHLNSSLQSRSAVLGGSTSGPHAPKISSKLVIPGRHGHDVVAGFFRAWQCMLQPPTARSQFIRYVHRLRTHKMRRIYGATSFYDRIRQRSIQPASLRYGTEREVLISHMCQRPGVPPKIIDGEIAAIIHFDVPSVQRKPSAGTIVTEIYPPAELVKTLRARLRLGCG